MRAIPLDHGRCLAAKSPLYYTHMLNLKNQSIRSNITYSSSFDAELYSNVIRCCALGPDLASLDCGDMTVVGSKGFSLSAGQRQRIV